MNNHTCPRCRKPLLPYQSLILIGTQWAHVDCESSGERQAVSEKQLPPKAEGKEIEVEG